MRIEIPELSVVTLIGVSGSGKSTFASKHFKATEVLSSDFFRGLISDDDNNQGVSQEAFETLYYIANKRLNLQKTVVIDATNVQKKSRESVLYLAKEQNCIPVAIVFNIPEKVCQERNEKRTDRKISSQTLRSQTVDLKRSIKNLKREGFRRIYVLNTLEDVEQAEIVRIKLWNNKKDDYGPFDIIGDIHGCFDELCELLVSLGYEVTDNFSVIHPEGRRAIFLGDLCDRGPKNKDVLRLVMNMVESNNAMCVPGNHDIKLLKKLRGGNVNVAHGLANTLEELAEASEEFVENVKKFLFSLVSHYVLDNGKLVVAHAGLKEHLQGRGSSRVRDFCLYGETTGETDEYGLPVRFNWANEYRGKAMVVYGHTPQVDVQSINNTWCIDTGCVFGGKLTAMRYPEKELVSVSAKKVYCEPVKPLIEKQEEYNDILHIQDVTGKRFLTTRLDSGVTISEDSSNEALEIMSRFAVDPHWLIYLPPTMSPCETSKLDGILEHPIEAFDYYKSRGVTRVICEQKHMGSRAVIVMAKSVEAAKEHFHVSDGKQGVIYTRTGRQFFNDESIEKTIIERLGNVLEASGFWSDFQTDWVCLDTELMPWSAKAQSLLENQYSSVGRTGRQSLSAVVEILSETVKRNFQVVDMASSVSGQNVNLQALLDEHLERKDALEKYTEAYRRYCWNVENVDDYRIAPFHILATEGSVHNDKEHLWHMDTVKKYIVGMDKIFMLTDYMIIDVNSNESIEIGINWWENLTNAGEEGIVVKPTDFIVMNGTTVLQPAVKCRGKEYLRIIYGPEYTLKENIHRLKKRSLHRKRQLALKEFALGMESLERFVKKQPLHQVHECVFGILALESKPLDPRL